MGVLGALADWTLAALTFLGIGGGGLAGYMKRVDGKAEDAKSLARKNERQLTGDPSDPNTEGVLTIAYETRDELREFRRETKREHEQVMDRLDEIEE